jgi:type I site-specific restriction endonuclease
MIDLIWDLFQHGQISNLQQGKLAQIEKERNQDAKAERIDDRLAELEQRHEQLKLVTLALWALLRDRSGLKESELRKYVEQVDLLDGTRDGKASRPADTATCSGCKRTVIGTSKVCVYCGAAVSRSSMFLGT